METSYCSVFVEHWYLQHVGLPGKTTKMCSNTAMQYRRGLTGRKWLPFGSLYFLSRRSDSLVISLAKVSLEVRLIQVPSRSLRTEMEVCAEGM